MGIIRGFSRLLLFFISFILLQLVRPSQAQQPNLGYTVNCSSSGNYSSNGTYKANLNTLLSSISSNTEINYGFYNFSAGENSNKVNAIALCRGDLSKEECRSLVNYSITQITQLCPNQKEAIVWYDDIMLRYSNRSIFRTVEGGTFTVLTQHIFMNSSLNQFITALGNLMGDLRSRAASGTSIRKFATGEANLSHFQTIHGLVQCTPDLSQLQCNSCLADAISRIPSSFYGKQSGRVIGPSCNIRHEILSTEADAPSPSPLPSPSSPLAQQANLLYDVCSSSGNYSSNSTYKANLNTLLSSISNNTEIDYGFYNFSAGENSNKVNAIALCRGDISKEKCRSLINYSTVQITELCPNQKEAIVWYDGLMLRYSNRSIFRTVERRTFSMLNTNSIMNSSLNQFITALGNLMGDLRSRAASGTSLRKFATGEANFGYNQTIYGLVQCTPDLSQLQCNNCLADAISHIRVCCYGKQGGRVIGPSCNLNYEIYPFIESTVGDAPSPSPAPSPSSPPRTNTTATTGKEKFSTEKIIAIVVPIVVALVLFFTLCFCFERRERRKKYDAVIEKNGTKGKKDIY